MSCLLCGQGFGAQNDTSGRPIRVGEPLSTANERAYILGAIPEVIRFANYTTVAGKAVVGKLSSAGIGNTSVFFKSRSGYANKNQLQSGSTCA